MTSSTPEITPFDPAYVQSFTTRDLNENPPDLAAKTVLPINNQTRNVSKILLWMTVDVENHFDQLVRTLTHEIHHDLLYQLISEEAAIQLDNITSQGTYLIDGDVDL